MNDKAFLKNWRSILAASRRPPNQQERRRRIRLSRRSSWLLVILSLLLSVTLFNYARNFEALQAQSQFEKQTTHRMQLLRSQLHIYAQLLNGAAAAAEAGIGQDAFSQYVSNLDLARTAPGILGIDLVRSSEPVNAVSHTLDAARGFTEPLLSPQLVNASNGATSRGFVMVRALAQDHQSTQPPSWVALWFTGKAVLDGITPTKADEFTLVVTDDAQNIVTTTAPKGAFVGAQSTLYQAALYGRTWTAKFQSTHAFDRAHASNLPHFLLLIGLVISFALALSLRVTATHHRKLKSAAALRDRQLDARNEENRALLESSVSVVVMLDSEGVITYANEAAAKLFQCDASDFVGKWLTDFVKAYPDDARNLIYNAKGMLECGTCLMLDVQSNSWRTAEGRLKTTVLIRDVTDQVNNQLQIEALHRRYDIALDGAGIGVFEIDLQTGATEMSATWHRIVGTDPSVGAFDHQRDFMGRVHADDLPLLLEADRACIAGETPRSVAEYRFRFGDAWRWMYSDAVPSAVDAQGQATGLIGTQCDVTELCHARNALELSEARFRAVLEEAPVGMAVMDDAGRFLNANGALTRLCGYDAEVLTADMRLAQLLSRKCYVRLSRDVRKLLRSGGSETLQSEVQLRTHSGETCWGLFNLSWTYDKNRDEHVYIAQIVDITDQKRVEQIKSEFIATISHELRTPLTSIKGALGLLEASSGKDMPAPAQRLLEIAQVNSDRLTVIVNNILDLERISSGEVAFEMAQTPLAPLIEDTIVAMKPEAELSANELVLTGDTQEVVVKADVARIRQVLMNLLSNACKFSDRDTDVVVRVQVTDQIATVFIENTGPPIPEHFQSRMFEAFTQVDASDTRSKGGAGLGLRITREIVARLGGEVGFEQSSERKVVFWFTCPLAFSDDVIEWDADSETTAPRADTLRVLHIEDDRDFCDVIDAGFGSAATVVPVHSLRQARGLIGRTMWDAILLDWSMPDGDASELLDTLVGKQPQAPIIVLSAETRMPQDRRVTATLIKSQVDIAQIVHHVSTAVQGYQKKAVG